MKKNMRGFTLVEMVTVIGIIVMLSAAVVTGTVQYVRRANDLSAEIEEHNFQYEAGKVQADSYLVGFIRDTLAQATTEAVVTSVISNGDDNDPIPNNNGGGALPADPEPEPALNVTAPGGYTSDGKGVASITPQGNDKCTVKVQNDPWNTTTFTVKKNGDNYTITFTGGNKYILQEAFTELWRGDTFTLSQAQIDYLQNSYGLVLG